MTNSGSDHDRDPRIATDPRGWWLGAFLADTLGTMLAILLPFLIAGAVVIFFVAQAFDLPLRDAAVLASCAFLMVFAAAGALTEDCGFISPGWGLVIALLAGLAIVTALLLSISILVALPILILAAPIVWVMSFFNS